MHTSVLVAAMKLSHYDWFLLGSITIVYEVQKSCYLKRHMEESYVL